MFTGNINLSNMGKRQANALQYINRDYDFTVPKLPNITDYKASPYYAEMYDIYKRLGGILDQIPFNLKPCYIDMAVNGAIIEIDEENHWV